MNTTDTAIAAVARAVSDGAEMISQDRQAAGRQRTVPYYHYVESADSYIKVASPAGCPMAIGPDTRGAVAWALRAPGRQVTLSGAGRPLLFEDASR